MDQPKEQDQAKAISSLRVIVYAIFVCQLAFCLFVLSIKSDTDNLAKASLKAYRSVLVDMKNRSMFPNNKFAQIPDGLTEFSVRIRLPGGSGSGVLVSKDHIITNYHVVQNALQSKTVWVDFPNLNGTATSVVGIIDGVDAARDLALIKLPAEAKKWAKLSASEPASYSPIIAISCPNGHLPLATSGYFGRKTSDGRYEMSISAFWGSSGGPVYDPSSGELVCLFNEIDHPHMQSFQGQVENVYPTSIFMGIPSTWIKDMMKRYNVSNEEEAMGLDD